MVSRLAASHAYLGTQCEVLTRELPPGISVGTTSADRPGKGALNENCDLQN